MLLFLFTWGIGGVIQSLTLARVGLDLGAVFASVWIVVKGHIYPGPQL